MIGNFFPSLLCTNEEEAREFAEKIGADSIDEYYYLEDGNPKFMGWIFLRKNEVIK